MIIVESPAEERNRLLLVAIAEARITHTSRDRLYALKLIAADKQRRRNAWREIAELAQARRIAA